MWRVAALQDAHRRWLREKHWIKQICVLRWEQWPDWSVKLFTCNLQDVKNSLRSAMMKFAEMLLCSGRVAQRQVHENETFIYFGCVNLMISSRWKKLELSQICTSTLPHPFRMALVMSQGLSCVCPTHSVSWRDWNAVWGPSTGGESRVESWELCVPMVLKLAWQHWELKLIYVLASDALELLCFWVSVAGFPTCKWSKVSCTGFEPSPLWWG